MVLLLMQGMTSVWVKLDFMRRQDYIAKKLCVNRNRPELQCNGKCYLSFRLNKALQEKEQQAPAQRDPSISAWVYITPDSGLRPFAPHTQYRTFSDLSPQEQDGFRASLDQPPEFLA